jgi:hypothetical protein
MNAMLGAKQGFIGILCVAQLLVKTYFVLVTHPKSNIDVAKLPVISSELVNGLRQRNFGSQEL